MKTLNDTLKTQTNKLTHIQSHTHANIQETKNIKKK